MNIEEFRAYCMSKKEVTESFPFGRLPDCLVFKVGGKMFTATDINTFASITLKSHPDLVDERRATYTAVQIPGYMNKRHWNRIVMDGSIPDQKIYEWIDESYNLVIENLPKSIKEKVRY